MHELNVFSRGGEKNRVGSRDKKEREYRELLPLILVSSEKGPKTGLVRLVGNAKGF